MAVSGTDLLWGCPQMNFKANPPFNEMTQGFAAFKKEIRMAQYLPALFENLRRMLLSIWTHPVLFKKGEVPGRKAHCGTDGLQAFFNAGRP